MRMQCNALALGAVFTLAACNWFDVDTKKPDSGLNEGADGGDQRPTDGGPDSGSGGSGGQGGGGAGGSGNGGSGGRGGEGTGGASGSSGEGGSGGGASTDPLDGGMDASPDGTIEDPDAGPLDPLGADLTWHPQPMRFAVALDSYAENDRRLWLVAGGGEGREQNRLVSFKPNDTSGRPWLDTGIAGLTSSPEALSYYNFDASANYQRVFFTRDGELHMYRFGPGAQPDMDDDSGAGELVEVFPPPADYVLTGGDIAAVDWSLARDLIYVMAAAEKAGQAGYYCLFELDPQASSSTYHCSAEPVLSEGTEIVTQVGFIRYFFVRDASLGLMAIIVNGEGGLSDENVSVVEQPLGDPGVSLGASLAMVYAETFDPNVLAIDENGRAWSAVALVEATDAGVGLAEAEWTALPELPLGQRLRTDGAALSAIDTVKHEENESPRATKVLGLGEDGVVYYTKTREQDGEDVWGPVWAPMPSLGIDQPVRALGGITAKSVAPGGKYEELAHGWNVMGGERGRVMQVSYEAYGGLWSEDAMRPYAPAPVSLEIEGAAEVSVASGADLGIAAATLRSTDVPRIVLSGSVDNASSWHPFAFEPLPTDGDGDVPVAALDAVAGYGDQRLHLINREIPHRSECSALESSHEQRIVYRRADDVRELVALQAGDLDLVPVASGGQLGPPSMVVTENELGATVHALFNDYTDRHATYWRLPIGSSSPTLVPFGQELPLGKLHLAGSGSSVHAVSMINEAMYLCDLSADDVRQTEVLCALRFLEVHPLHDRVTHFGPPSQQPQGFCPMVGNEYFKCFMDERPYSLAVSAMDANKLYVAYAGNDDERSSIYLAESEGGTGYGAFHTIEISDRGVGDTREFFDAEITVHPYGAGEAVFITYSAFDPESGSAIAESFSAHRPVADAGFHITSLGTWDMGQLSYDCASQRWALGNYRDPDRLGGRSLHVVRSDEPEPGSHVTRWLNDRVRP